MSNEFWWVKDAPKVVFRLLSLLYWKSVGLAGHWFAVLVIARHFGSSNKAVLFEPLINRLDIQSTFLMALFLSRNFISPTSGAFLSFALLLWPLVR